MATTKEKSREYYINHQKVILDVDFESKTILASTEIMIYVNTKDIPYIRLNSKNCEINNVSVNEFEVLFEIFDSHKQICESSQFEDSIDPDYYNFQKLYDLATTTSQNGDLCFKIPSEIDLDNHIAPEIAENLATDGANGTKEPKITAPLIVRIDYSIKNPSKGIVFTSNCRAEEEIGASYLHTQNQLGPGDACSWVPTKDEIYSKHSWEIDFLIGEKRNHENKKIDLEVVSSGALVEKVDLSCEPPRTLYSYLVSTSCPAYLIAFAIGRFESLMLAELDSFQNERNPADISSENTKKIYGYAPFGWDLELRNSCQVVEKIMDFYINEFGSFPLDSTKLVFLKTSCLPMVIGYEVIILSIDFLHTGEIIDQTFETRRIIALSLASQWFGVCVVPKLNPDIWLTLGLSGFMCSLFLRSHFGLNEYRYRMKQDMVTISKLDSERPPIFNANITYPYDPEEINFIRLKATFVLYMLDKQMLKGAASFGLHRIIPKILSSALYGELEGGNFLNTQWFLKSARKLSGVDIRSFNDQWIYKSGCPVFEFKYTFNRKKMVVEITFNQTHTNAGLVPDFEGYDNIKPCQVFTGAMTASIREPDGTPYEHVLEIQDDSVGFEVQFNTKYKRIRRSTKRFQKRKAEAAAAEAIVKDQLDEKNADNDELFLTEEGNEAEKEDWRIVDWGDTEDGSTQSATFEWIRLDSDFEWICIIKLEQPDYMWAGQLEKDRDVVSQFEAVEALKNFPSPATSTTLLRTVMNSQCFYRIRAEAAKVLIYCSDLNSNYIGRHHLFKTYSKKYNLNETLRNPLDIVNYKIRPNDFSNFSEYFVLKAIILAISCLGDLDAKNMTESPGQLLVLKLLKENDNSGNPYSDSYYLSTLITAIGNLFDHEISHYYDKRLSITAQSLIDELKRYSNMDYLIPSYHNVITTSCLQSYTKLYIKGVLQPDLKLFMSHSRYGNFSQVRMAAFDGLFLQSGILVPCLQKYFLRTILKDPELHIRNYVAHNLAKACALYKQKCDAEKPSEEDHFGPTLLDDSVHQSNDGYSKEKWETFTKSSEVKRRIWEIIRDTKVDVMTLRSMLIICKLIFPSTFGSDIDFSRFKLRSVNYFPDPPPPEPSPVQLPIKSDTVIKIKAPQQPNLEVATESDSNVISTRLKTPSFKISLKVKSPVAVKAESDIKEIAPTRQATIVKQEQFDLGINHLNDSIPDLGTTQGGISIPEPIKTAYSETVEEPITVDSGFNRSDNSEVLETLTSNLNQVSIKVESDHELETQNQPFAPWTDVIAYNESLTQITPPSPKSDRAKEVAHPKDTTDFVETAQLQTSKPIQFSKTSSSVEHKDGATISLHRAKVEESEVPLLEKWDLHPSSIRMPYSTEVSVRKPNDKIRETLYRVGDGIATELQGKELASSITKAAETIQGQKTKAHLDKERKADHKRAGSNPGPYSKDRAKSKGSPQLNLKQHKVSCLPSPSGGLSLKLEPTGPMSVIDYDNAMRIVKKMVNHEHANLFFNPNPTKFGLAKIESKVESRQYNDFDEFRKDFRRLLDTFPKDPVDSTKDANARSFRSYYLAERKKVVEQDGSGGRLPERKKLVSVTAKELSSSSLNNFPLEKVAKAQPNLPVYPQGSQEIIATKRSSPAREVEVKGTPDKSILSRPKDTDMDPVSYQEVKALLKMLMNHEDSVEFRNAPENVVSLGASHPNAPVRSLNSVRYCLKNKQYPSVASAFSDIQKVLLGNGGVNETGLTKRTLRLFEWFSKEWRLKFPGFSIDNSQFNITVVDKVPKPVAKANVENPVLGSPAPLSKSTMHPNLSPSRLKPSSPVSKFISSTASAPVPSTTDVLRFCKSIVLLLVDSPSSPLFRVPVDAKKLNIPTYYKIIKKPMDLSTLNRKVDSGSYKTVSEFDSDTKLIFANACSFNEPASLPYTEAKKLECYYKSLFKNCSLILTDATYSLIQKVVNKISKLDCLQKLEMFIDAKVFTEPMNLDRIKQRLAKKLYAHFGEFEYDFKTLLSCVLAEVEGSSDEFKWTQELETSYGRLHKKYLDFYATSLGSLCATAPKELVTFSNKTKCEAILKKISAHKSAVHFLERVDYVALKIPDYPKTIRNPMDLGTIKSKLRGKKYLYLQGFYDDVKLVFTNCYNFNGLDSYYGEEAKRVETVFEKEWKMFKGTLETSTGNPLPIGSPPKKMKFTPTAPTALPSALVSKFDKVLNAFAKHIYYFLVSEPVDPVALNIPTYFDVIKCPMDFGTIKSKLHAGKYATASELFLDADLVFSNCFTFNLPGDDAYAFGKDLQVEWNKLCKQQGLSRSI